MQKVAEMEKVSCVVFNVEAEVSPLDQLRIVKASKTATKNSKENKLMMNV